MKYRTEIDGLRALAVVPVILFHAGFELFSGGFVGVDVFFVISGYLITTILVDDIENNRFSIVNFYERRARRILPALFFVMLVCIPFAWMWMIPSQMKGFSQSLVAVSLFASNILFWRESGYFDTAAEEKPLLHTWSLAVEEQYYVLFPVFLLFAWRFRKDRVFWMIVVMAVISLILSEWGWRNKATANFYLAPTRAWELFAGSIAAFVVQKHGVQKSDVLSLLGLAAIVFAIFAYDESTPFPSVFALVPVVGVVLLVLFAEKETLTAKLLSTKAFVGVGLISYSAYLWHQPLFAFARIRLLEEPSEVLMVILSVSSLVLAVASWKYIETPFRRKTGFFSNKKIVFLMSTVGLIVFFLLGVFGHMHNRYLTSIKYAAKPDFLLTLNLLDDAKTSSPVFINENRFDDGSCRFSVTNINEDISRRILECRESFEPGVLVFGDSHATNMYHSLIRNPDNSSDMFIIGITKNGCHLPTNKSGCQYSEVLDFVSNHPDVFSFVIYEKAGYLMLDFDGARGDLRYADTEEANVDLEVVGGVLNYLQTLALHTNVIWFGPRIEPLISEGELLSATCGASFELTQTHLSSFQKLDDYLKVFASNPRLQYVSQIDAYAFDFPRDFGGCNGLYWMDENHFSVLGETEFGSRFNILRVR